jgi:cell division septation protein DedD
MKVAAVAAAGLGVGYYTLARDERAVDTSSRGAPARPALAGPAGASQVVAPVRPADTIPTAGADSDPAVKAAATAGLSGTGLYAVQIAAVPGEGEAEQLLDWLAREGYSAYLEPTTTGRGRLLRVRVGPLPSLDVAQDVAGRLGKAGYATSWITEVDRTQLR